MLRKLVQAKHHSTLHRVQSWPCYQITGCSTPYSSRFALRATFSSYFVVLLRPVGAEETSPGAMLS
jgi:hypothetical protein